jgi:hypothetical protein
MKMLVGHYLENSYVYFINSSVNSVASVAGYDFRLGEIKKRGIPRSIDCAWHVGAQAPCLARLMPITIGPPLLITALKFQSQRGIGRERFSASRKRT